VLKSLATAHKMHCTNAINLETSHPPDNTSSNFWQLKSFTGLFIR